MELRRAENGVRALWPNRCLGRRVERRVASRSDRAHIADVRKRGELFASAREIRKQQEGDRLSYARLCHRNDSAEVAISCQLTLARRLPHRLDRGETMTDTQTGSACDEALIAQGRGLDWSKIAVWIGAPIAMWSTIIASLWWTL